MYAIISDGTRQYKVHQGQDVSIDYRKAQAGDAVRFERILAVSDGKEVKIGRPLVEGASVTGEVLGIAQGKKIVVQKLRRRKNSRRKTGHRQLYTTVKINHILIDGEPVVEDTPADEDAESTPESENQSDVEDKPETGADSDAAE